VIRTSARVVLWTSLVLVAGFIFWLLVFAFPREAVAPSTLPAVGGSATQGGKPVKAIQKYEEELAKRLPQLDRNMNGRVNVEDLRVAMGQAAAAAHRAGERVDANPRASAVVAFGAGAGVGLIAGCVVGVFWLAKLFG
jgi:ElaB/YqjD/DUF883 family membrane-anchored ribosome-binding protein